VSGAPTTYWTRNFINWGESTAEQWPYRVKFHQTNVYGEANNNTLPTSVENVPDAQTSRFADNNVYSLTGQLIRRGTISTEGLPRGIYIVGGRRVAVK
jgi:hypothetical protein